MFQQSSAQYYLFIKKLNFISLSAVKYICIFHLFVAGVLYCWIQKAVLYMNGVVLLNEGVKCQNLKTSAQSFFSPCLKHLPEHSASPISATYPHQHHCLLLYICWSHFICIFVSTYFQVQYWIIFRCRLCNRKIRITNRRGWTIRKAPV